MIYFENFFLFFVGEYVPLGDLTNEVRCVVLCMFLQDNVEHFNSYGCVYYFSLG